MLSQQFKIDTVFGMIEAAHLKQKGTIKFGSIHIKITKKLRVFFQKGVKCDVCGIEGQHFLIKKQKGNMDMYLDLIASNGKGKHKRSMTMDHTIPLCVGGNNTYDNLMPMCDKCNSQWKSQFDQELKRNVAGISEDGQHYLYYHKE